MSSLALSKLKKKTPLEMLEKPKKKCNRFDGLSEEEVQKYTLIDYLEENLDMVFVGINPSLMAAHRGRYYAGSGNHFYKLLHESGLTPRFVSFEEDYKLLQYGIGLTNIVARATRSSADLKKSEIKEGATLVREKLEFYKPKIAIFNGKCIYEVFANKTHQFNFGLQPERIGATAIWVIPSSSARCANFPRMQDKLHFYTSLKKYLQFLKGEIDKVDVKEFWFEGKCKQFIPSTSKMWRRKNLSAFLHGGRVANKDTVCLDTSDENVAIAHSTEFIIKKVNSESDSGEEVNSIAKKVQNSEEFIQQKGTENSQCNTNIQLQEDLVDSVQVNTNSSQSNDDPDEHYESIKENNVKTVPLTKKKVNISVRKRKLKRSSPTPIQTKCYIRSDTSADFVNLIKQRLQEKAEKGNVEED
ncbi:hypothetical protein KM043_014932 [Ampulex compressa]|nr:hypothetical protein KM043_014932 [Ampulex compressa]